MKKNKYKFVIVSANDNFKLFAADFRHVLEDQRAALTTIANNTLPLSEVYNKQLQDFDAAEFDYLVLMHADIFLDVDKLVDHIDQCAEKYDLMGLCGTEVVKVSNSPLSWYTASRQTPEKRWGYVVHGELDNQASYFSNHSPEILDHEVAAVDGLCLILSKNLISAGIRFDTKFLFDFYDLDLCFQCLMNYKMKIGCLVQKDLYHYSVGKSILKPDFLTHEKDFRDKWGIQLS